MSEPPVAKRAFPRWRTAAPRAAPPSDKPAHYRLSKDVWAVILQEYREGATGPELELKWRVSGHALRKQITKNESTKRDWGDQMAAEQAAARDAAMIAARETSPEARAARLFEPDFDDDPDAGDPAALMKLATLASGRAMRGRLWTEAKALASLAESYRRLAAAAAEPARGEGPFGGRMISDEEEGDLRDQLMARMERIEAEMLAEEAEWVERQIRDGDLPPGLA